MKKKFNITVASAVLVLLLTGLDQWTKYAVATQMKVGQTIEIIKRFFYITYVQNTGAGFSIFEGYGKPFFFVVTIAALVFMLTIFYKTKDPGVQLTIAIIFSGAIGNFIDRMRLGYVIDFFHFYIFGWSFPVFNVADICISVGFVLLVIHMLKDEWKAKRI